MSKLIIKNLLSGFVIVETIFLLCRAGCSGPQKNAPQNLIGSLVMNGCGDIKSCSFFENGKKESLRKYIFIYYLITTKKLLGGRVEWVMIVLDPALVWK